MTFTAFRRDARLALLITVVFISSSYHPPAIVQSQVGPYDAPHDYSPLPDFDLRQRFNRVAKAQTRRSILNISRVAADGVVLKVDDMELPHHIFSTTGPLTSHSSEDAPTIARNFVRDNRALFRITDRQLDKARVSARATDARGRFTRLALEQRVNGIRVFGGDMLFIIDREGRLVSQSGSFIPETDNLALGSSPALSPIEALNRAAAECGVEFTAAVAVTEEGLPSRYRFIFASSEIDERSEASLVYYALTPRDVRLAYQVLLYGVPAGVDSYLVLIDAATGRLLRRTSLTYAVEGRVFTKENPVVSVERQRVSLDGDPAFSPSGWLNGNRLEGNNTQVFFNPFGQQNGGEVIEVNTDGSFDFPLDLSPGRSPLDFSKASAANLFYWVNASHDRFYELGFDEASRNFQTDNFGRGGSGGDAIRAETLRGARLDPSRGGLVRNNAFFATTVDGSPPLLAMLLWAFSVNGQTVELDSSYDAGVIIHEYTHGVSTRLTGTDNTIGLSGSLQGRGMGEGWSDFFAMSFLNGSDLPLDQAVATGSYVTQRARGVRLYPYTPIFDINPLTFGDIQPISAVHSQGTVWCSILWDMRQALIERYGFETGRDIAEQLVIDGLKHTPISPLFTDARDAILLADRTTNGGANQETIWRAFARRGLGAKATTFSTVPHTGFRIHAEESYEIPPEVTSGTLVINDRHPAAAVLFESMPVLVFDRDLTGQSGIEARAVNTRTGESVAFALAVTEAGRFAGEIRVLPPEADAGPGARITARPGDEILVIYDNARDEAGRAERLEARATAGRRVTVYETGFDSGAREWDMQELWHVTKRRAASPDSSLYFAKKKGKGERKSFTPKGRVGAAFSPEIDTSGMLKPKLEFDYVFIGAQSGGMFEPPGDLMSMSASNFPFINSAPIPQDEPRFQLFFDVRPEPDAVFRRVAVDLHFIEMRKAYLSFSFMPSPADVKRKMLEGFYLDNIRVTAVLIR